MVESCDRYILCQVDMIANINRTYDCVSQSDACIISDCQDANCIIQTGEVFDNRIFNQRESVERREVFAYTPIDDRTLSAFQVYEIEEPYPTIRASFNGVHDKSMYSLF